MALDHFGFLAPFYDRLIKFGEADALARRLDLPVQGRVLDAGGGTGRVAAAMTGMAGQVVVADVSLGMLAQAREKNLVVACSVAERLPFPSGTFDRVLMMDALHHVHNQADTARDLWRVLAPGGRILIVEPDIRTCAAKAIVLFEKVVLMRSHFLSPQEIAGLFEGLGAQVRFEAEKATAWVVIEKERQLL
jgi:ubiquinone/menaquinone biosynthesis C-methylase UbiE